MSQKLTYRQTMWLLFLAEYTFTLYYKLERVNDKADALFRRPDHKKGVENNNFDYMFLKLEFLQIKAAK